jgi:hypothetical protein
MSTTPTVLNDHYGEGFENEANNKRRKGPPAMRFGGIKGDKDRMDKCNRLTNNFIDNTPGVSER